MSGDELLRESEGNDGELRESQELTISTEFAFRLLSALQIPERSCSFEMSPKPVKSHEISIVRRDQIGT